jgi:hypothetical protein
MDRERLMSSVKSALDYARAEVRRNGHRLRASRTEILLLALEWLKNIQPPVISQLDFTMESFERWIKAAKKRDPRLKEEWLVCAEGPIPPPEPSPSPGPPREEPHLPPVTVNGVPTEPVVKGPGADNTNLDCLLEQQNQLIEQMSVAHRDTNLCIDLLSTSLDTMTKVSYTKIAEAVKEGVRNAVAPLVEQLTKNNDRLYETAGWIVEMLVQMEKREKAPQQPEKKDEPSTGMSRNGHVAPPLLPVPLMIAPPAPVAAKPGAPPKVVAIEDRTLGARQPAPFVPQLVEQGEVYDETSDGPAVNPNEDDLGNELTPAMLEWARLSKRVFNGKELTIAIVAGKPARYEATMVRVLEQLSAAHYISVPTFGKGQLQRSKEKIREKIRKDRCHFVLIVAGWCGHDLSNYAARECKREGIPFARLERVGQTNSAAAQLLHHFRSQRLEMLQEESGAKVGK